MNIPSTEVGNETINPTPRSYDSPALSFPGAKPPTITVAALEAQNRRDEEGKDSTQEPEDDASQARAEAANEAAGSRDEDVSSGSIESQERPEEETPKATSEDRDPDDADSELKSAKLRALLDEEDAKTTAEAYPSENSAARKSFESSTLSYAPKPEEIRRMVEAAPSARPELKAESPEDLSLDALITHAAKIGASDLFIKAGSPPAFKLLNGVVLGSFPVLSPNDTRRLAYEHMTENHKAQFEQTHELNLSFTVAGAARIRQNVYFQRGTVATTCRLIPFEVKTLAELGINSKAVMNLSRQNNGLVLVTGPTGAGKTTTLAAIINDINESRAVNIITIEDPVEYVHRDKKGIVSQREVGVDTDSFSEALKQILRQTPDVILIGELRDLETLNVALMAAETGHLVFATLHTASAAETLDRVSNMYAPSEREMLWLRLSVSLRGVISQKLCRKADGSGRVVAMEILVATPTVSKQLEDGRSDDLYAAIRSDGEEDFWGMITMNQCLDKFYRENLITEEEALLHSGNLPELKQMLRRANHEKEGKKKAPVD